MHLQHGATFRAHIAHFVPDTGRHVHVGVLHEAPTTDRGPSGHDPDVMVRGKMGPPDTGCPRFIPDKRFNEVAQPPQNLLIHTLAAFDRIPRKFDDLLWVN